jgi:hypothetical protein
MIGIGNERPVSGSGHKEEEVSEGDKSGRWIPWRAFPRGNPAASGPGLIRLVSEHSSSGVSLARWLARFVASGLQYFAEVVMASGDSFQMRVT